MLYHIKRILWRCRHLLEIRNVKSKSEAISELSLCVSGNGIYGVLCASERARTELARAIGGCEDVLCGEIIYDGELMSTQSLALKKRVRLVPSRPLLDDTDTPEEYLNFVGYTVGVEPEKRYRQIKEALRLMELEEVSSTAFAHLDVSQRVRLCVAGALIGNPDVIVIDDPLRRINAGALDGIYDTLSMIGKRKTVILMSHTPAEVKRLCERVAIISGGKVVLEGKTAEIESKINSTRELIIKARGDWEQIRTAIESVQRVVRVSLVSSEKNNVNVIRVEHTPDSKMKDRVFGALSEINVHMLSAEEIVLTLDDVYRTLTANDRSHSEVADTKTHKRRSKRK